MTKSENRGSAGTNRDPARAERQKSVQDPRLHERRPARSKPWAGTWPTSQNSKRWRNSGHWQSHRRENQGAGGNRFAQIFRRTAGRISRRILELFSLPGLGRRRSRRSTNTAGQFDRPSAGRPAMRVRSRISLASERRRRRNFARRSRTRQTRRHFSARPDRERSRNVAERFALASGLPCTSALPEVIGGGKKLCATLISSWRRKRRKKSRNFSLGIRWLKA